MPNDQEFVVRLPTEGQAPVVSEVNFIVSEKKNLGNYESKSLSCGMTVSIPPGANPFEVLSAKIAEMRAFIKSVL